jgi:hypothetical protein
VNLSPRILLIFLEDPVIGEYMLREELEKRKLRIDFEEYRLLVDFEEYDKGRVGGVFIFTPADFLGVS